jgi:hypothetical protein
VGFAGGSGGEGLVARQRSGCHGEPREIVGRQSVAHRERGGLAGWPIAREEDGLGTTGKPGGGQSSGKIGASANSLHGRFRRASVLGWNILQQLSFRLANDLHRAARGQGSKSLQAKGFVRASWLLGRSLAAGMAIEARESRGPNRGELPGSFFPGGLENPKGCGSLGEEVWYALESFDLGARGGEARAVVDHHRAIRWVMRNIGPGATGRRCWKGRVLPLRNRRLTARQ